MDLPLPTARRDRLLAALLAGDPSMVLLRWDPEVALVFSPAGPARVILFTVPPGLSPDAARAHFTRHVKAVAQGSPPTFFVAVGGGPEVAAALRAAAPLVEQVPMGFYHLDDAGACEHLKSRGLPALERATAAPIQADTPFDPAPIAAALARGSKLVQQGRTVAERLRGRYTVTAAITVVCAALAGLAYLWGGFTDVGYQQAIWRMGANDVGAVRGGEAWRLFASAFLHGGAIHLAVNMYSLWMLGPMLEAILGRRRYILLYGACALGGALASAFLHTAGAYSSVGASGAIWGLMTAYIALAYRPRGVIPPQMAANLRRGMWTPLVLNIGISFVPGIDKLAHFGGGAVGFALTATVLTSGLVPIEERKSQDDVERRPGPLMGIAAGVVAFAMGASVVAALVTGRPWAIGAPPVLERAAIGDTGLTMEVPSEGARNPKVTAKDHLTRVDFGTRHEEPVMIEAVVVPLTRAPSSDELEPFLDEARKDFDEHGPQDWKRTTPTKKVMLGDRAALVVEHDASSEVHVRSYLVIVGNDEVIVRGYAGKQRPRSWEGLEEKVAASVR